MKRTDHIPAVLPTNPTKEERALISELESQGRVCTVSFKTKLKTPRWFHRYCRQAIGNARKMWNHLVELYRRKTEEDPSWRYRWMEEKKKFIAQDRKNYPYFMLVASDAYKEKFRDFSNAVNRYIKDKFDKTKSESVKAGAPTFHKKSWVSGSFRINGTATSIAMGVRGKSSSDSRHYIRIPNGDNFSPTKDKWVKLCEPIPFAPLQVMNVTFIQDGVDFYAAICMKVLIEDFKAAHSENLDCRVICGLDWGISAKATVATETDCIEIEPFKPPKRLEKHVKHLQRRLERKVHPRAKGDHQKGVKASKNYRKAQLKLRKAERKITNKRLDHERKITSALMRSVSAIGVENTNNKGMLKNHKLAKSISNASPGRFITRLKWVGTWRGVTVVQAEPFYPSTQKCSACGAVLKGEDRLKLPDRTYRCPVCYYTAGRDKNAARNLMLLARQAGGGSLPDFNALGEASSEVMTTDLDPLLGLLARDGLVASIEMKDVVPNTSAVDRKDLE